MFRGCPDAIPPQLDAGAREDSTGYWSIDRRSAIHGGSHGRKGFTSRQRHSEISRPVKPPEWNASQQPNGRFRQGGACGSCGKRRPQSSGTWRGRVVHARSHSRARDSDGGESAWRVTWIANIFATGRADSCGICCACVDDPRRGTLSVARLAD